MTCNRSREDCSTRPSACSIVAFSERAQKIEEILGRCAAVVIPPGDAKIDNVGRWRIGTIEIIAGDHQNKPDAGALVANRWFDVDGIDMITDLVNSAVGFAVVDVAKAKNKTVS